MGGREEGVRKAWRKPYGRESTSGVNRVCDHEAKPNPTEPLSALSASCSRYQLATAVALTHLDIACPELLL